jgi:HK97 family phage portal protein
VVSFFRRKRQPEERTLTRETVPAAYATPMIFGNTLAGTTINTTTALRLVDVLSCTRLLAESASLCPLKPYRKTDTGRVEFTGKVQQLLEAPAPGTVQANFVSQLVGCLALHGEAFIGKFRQDASGPIVQLGVIDPQYITKVELVNGEPRYTLRHRDTGRETVHDRLDVLHVRGLSFDGLRGISPIRQAAEALGLADALQKQASALASNGATPRGVLSVSAGPAQQDVMENLKTAWESRHRGAENTGRVAVIAGDAVSFAPLSVSPADAEFVAQRKLSTTEICRLMRVPAYLVSASVEGQSQTYSNTEMEGLNFLRFSLQPWLTLVEQSISNDPDLCPGNVYVEFKVDAILRTDSATRAQVFTQALSPQTGWLRREEVRELENLPPESQGPTPPPQVVIAPPNNGNGVPVA